MHTVQGMPAFFLFTEKALGSVHEYTTDTFSITFNT